MMPTVMTNPLAMMQRHIHGMTTGCSLGRGFLSMMLGSAGSTPSAMAGGRSVTRTRKRIWSGSRMMGSPITTHKKICKTSAKCTDMMNETNFWMPA